MATSRIYEYREHGKSRLVEANNDAVALRFCLAPEISITIPNQKRVAALMKEGVVVEQIPPKPKSEPTA